MISAKFGNDAKIAKAIAAEFDVDWYLSENSDVAVSGMDPILHYVRFGAKEGRWPQDGFDGNAYLACNEDVRESAINPFYHWLRHGRAEGRSWTNGVEKGSDIPAQSTAGSLSGIFTPFDWIDPRTASAINLAQLPDFLLGEGFPYNMEPGPVDFPIILFCDGHGKMPAGRIAQALALTRGEVYVNAEQTRKKGTWADKRVHFFSGKGISAIENLHGILLKLTTERVGLWGWSLSPALSSWQFLDAAMNRDPDLVHVSASLVKMDGALWRSGFSHCAGSLDIAPRGAGVHFLQPFEFRLKRSAAFDPVFGVARTSALLQAIKMMAEQEDESLVDVLAKLTTIMERNDRQVFGTAGNAVVFAKKEPAPLDMLLDGKNAHLGNHAGASRAVVFVDSVPPTPDQDAGSVTASNFIDIFIERGEDVIFFSTSERQWSNPYVLALAARGVVCITDASAANYDTACDMIKIADYDQLTFMLTRIYAGGEFVERTRTLFPRAQLLFNTVDLHGLRELREAKIAGSASGIFSAHNTFARERDIIQRCDATILLSEAELAELKPTLGHANLRLIPMVNEFCPPKAPFAKRNGLMFIGGFAHYPNVDAVEYILDELWAPIRSRDPSIELKIVGAHLPERLQRRLPKGVEAMGFVPDLDAALEMVRLTIAPLRYGAGIKGKIGTSLSHGVPCVATTLATEGMGLTDECELLVADDPDTFADAVLRVHNDEVLWNRLSRNGYDFCDARYSRRAVAAQLNELLDEVRE